MAMEILGIKFEASYEKAQAGVKKLGKSFDNISQKTQKTSDKVAGLAQKNKKLGQSFTNLNKDVNRSSVSLGKFSGMLSKLGSITGVYMLARGLSTAIESSMDMIETQNLFNVAMGEGAIEAGEFVDKLSQLSGLDSTNLRNSVASYGLLARSMGFSSDQAGILSTNTSKLALDLASLTNVPIAQVMGDLRSGLLGQSETVYKYGIDVTEASLKQEALNQGISKSVRNMSQGEKMALRYAVMLRQTSLVHGDFANTINQPANQLRILRERFSTLSRSIGSIFIPLLGAILPYANAVVIVLTRVANAIARLFGYKPPKDENGIGGIGGLSGDAEDAVGGLGKVGGGVDKVKKKVKELQKITLGIDELNVLPEPPKDSDDAGAGGGGGGLGGIGGGGILDGLDLGGYDNLMDGITSKADELAEKMEQALARIRTALRPTTEAFGFFMEMLDSHVKPFIFGTLYDFYDRFLVPVSTWTFSEGLPRFFDALSGAIQKVKWDKIREALGDLYEALGKFAIINMDAMLWVFENVLVPLGTWAMNNVIPPLIRILSGAFEILGSVFDAYYDVMKDVYRDVLIPLGEWTGGVVATVLDGIATAVEWLAVKFGENEDAIKSVITQIAGLALAWQGVKILSFIGQAGSLTGALKLLVVQLTAVKIAKLKDKIETMALHIWYAKDTVAKVANTVATKAKTIALGIGTIATKAHTVAMTAGAVAGKAFGAVMTFLTSPIGLVVVAIVAVIAIVVLLIKNWDKVKEVALLVWAKIKETWSAVAEWFNQKVVTPVRDFFDKMWTKIKEFASNAWTGIKGVWSAVAGWFAGIGTSIQTTFSNAWNALKTGASNAWTGIKGIFSAVGNFFKTTFENAWGGVKKIFSTGGAIFTGIKDGIANAFKNIVNALIRGVNRVISVPFNAINGLLNKVRSVSVLGISPFQNLIKYNAVSVPSIPQLARGGMVDGGGLFQAGEFGKAEMIGSYGGKTTVMPLENTDFVGAMYNAVFNAVSGAMTNNSGGNGDIILRVGEIELGRATMNGMKKVQRQEGRLEF